MSNYTYNDELMHYGVLGMKWGVHRAKRYAYDYNEYTKKQRDRAAKKEYKLKAISKDEYKQKLRDNVVDEHNANVEVNRKLRKLTPKDGEKISSIYSSYQKKTLSTIPNYRLKKGAKIAGKILAHVGLNALTVGLAAQGSWLGGMASANSSYAEYAAKLAKNPLTSIGAENVNGTIKVFKWADEAEKASRLAKAYGVRSTAALSTVGYTNAQRIMSAVRRRNKRKDQRSYVAISKKKRNK